MLICKPVKSNTKSLVKPRKIITAEKLKDDLKVHDNFVLQKNITIKLEKVFNDSLANLDFESNNNKNNVSVVNSSIEGISSVNQNFDLESIKNSNTELNENSISKETISIKTIKNDKLLRLLELGLLNSLHRFAYVDNPYGLKATAKKLESKRKYGSGLIMDYN